MHSRAALLMCLSLAACAWSEDGHSTQDAAPITRDPVIARALNDPLMTDPDLASINEANAAIGFADSYALPVLRPDPGEPQRVRETMRLELLASGPLPELPAAMSGQGGPPLGPMSRPAQLLAAVDAPEACTEALTENFAIAAELPSVAALPPLGMVVQAGGADRAGCGVRIVRYLTAAPAVDVLQYHYVRARRAGVQAVRYAAPGESISANGKTGERLSVHVRAAANGLTGVTLVYRSGTRAARRP